MEGLKLDNRKEIKIYDPALCCPTGLCGVNIDPELMRIAVVIETLKKKKGIIIERFNLKDNPQVYVDTLAVNKILMEEGSDAMPLTTINGEVVLKKTYPSNKQIAEWLEINEEELTIKQ
ncbi:MULTISPECIES: arsenite efflux transporter metallochaperone ArsD [Lascolabacillus]|jgi:hypothetical protein|uniref:arsenite efflux transporter metallochaperone ArsD n=1 Tax=Lascolabacillus TaxID=1924067 RepID=UPI0006B31B43|nr:MULTISPECIES: arsenite efflux transporter metallochaperone ArsD [Lascolabacillus]MDD2287419.1 arsenite efflux transporter metallochaperone ArsD [Bacteroidales bacterium]MDD4759015.1 arsenite efflux transporter metallochaperone ArsD [Lascolabacillus sp.]TAH60655.1 MAG: arsenite efflux transporter metallochaperone ArsD [Fermentimonas caenicola]